MAASGSQGPEATFSKYDPRLYHQPQQIVYHMRQWRWTYIGSMPRKSTPSNSTRRVLDRGRELSVSTRLGEYWMDDVISFMLNKTVESWNESRESVLIIFDRRVVHDMNRETDPNLEVQGFLPTHGARGHLKLLTRRARNTRTSTRT